MNSIQILDTYVIANQAVKHWHSVDRSARDAKLGVKLTPRQYLKYYASKNVDIHALISQSSTRRDSSSKLRQQPKKNTEINPFKQNKNEGDLDNGQELEV